jgi:hypothetical protein
MKASAIRRFIAKCEVDPATECWNWRGALIRAKNGRASARGTFRDGDRQVYAYRFAFSFYNGEIPEGREINHICRNTRCVNPQHLEALTKAQHQKVDRDLMVAGAWHPKAVAGRAIGSAKLREQKHCKAGHEFSDENTYRDPTGHRRCKTCKAEAFQTFHERQPEKRREYERAYRERHGERIRARDRARRPAAGVRS